VLYEVAMQNLEEALHESRPVVPPRRMPTTFLGPELVPKRLELLTTVRALLT
jgi:hypothetical protein